MTEDNFQAKSENLGHSTVPTVFQCYNLEISNLELHINRRFGRPWRWWFFLRSLVVFTQGPVVMSKTTTHPWHGDMETVGDRWWLPVGFWWLNFSAYTGPIWAIWQHGRMQAKYCISFVNFTEGYRICNISLYIYIWYNINIYIYTIYNII